MFEDNHEAATSPPVPDLAAIEVAAAREQGYSQAAEIVVLCAIARRPALAAGLIEHRLAVADVRKSCSACAPRPITMRTIRY